MAECGLVERDGTIVTITDKSGVERFTGDVGMAMVRFAKVIGERDAQAVEIQTLQSVKDGFKLGWGNAKDDNARLRGLLERLIHARDVMAECNKGCQNCHICREFACGDNIIMHDIRKAIKADAALAGEAKPDEHRCGFCCGTGDKRNKPPHYDIEEFYVDAGEECPCRSGGIGDDGLAKQPCDKCDRAAKP